MARNMYGATSADFTLTSGGRVVPGSVLTIWSARTGGTQITDLLDVDSVACTTVTSAADGSVVYYGPNNDKDTHWAQASQGSRIAIRPVNITGETGDKGDKGDQGDPGPAPDMSIGTVAVGAAAATITGTPEEPVLNLTLPSTGALQAQQSVNATGVAFITAQPEAAGAAAWTFGMDGNLFDGVKDPTMFIGYNAGVQLGAGTTGEPVLAMGFEANYRAVNWAGSGITENTCEWYLEYRSPDHTTIADFRPFAATLGRNENTDHWASIHIDIGRDASNYRSNFSLLGGSGATQKTLLAVLQTQAAWTIPMTMTACDLRVNSTTAGNARVAHHVDGSEKCYHVIYRGDSNFYLWDGVNNRYQVRYGFGNSDTAATTEYQSNVKVDGNVGFYGTTPAAKQAVSGSRGGNAALTSLLSALSTLGLITDSSTA